MSHGNFKIKRIAATSILCFSVLYSNTAFAVWPVTEEVLTPYVMGASPQSMGNGMIETLVPKFHVCFLLASKITISRRI